jgi:5-methylcytosine-specific restriction endonuclease McrA
MQARYYDPVGRMLSVDPIAGEAGDIFSFNRYTYANNDPISNIDLDGKQAEDAAEVEADFIRARQENLLRPLPPYQPPDPIISSIQTAQEAEANQEILHPGSAAKAFNDAVDRILNPTPESSQVSEAKISNRTPGADGKRGSTGGPGSGKRFPAEPPEVKAEKEGVPCVYCGTPTTNRSGQPNSRERDHIDPRSRGGNNSPENERDSCRSCNRRKGSKNPDEWRQ